MDRIQFELDSSISQYTNNYKKTFDKMNMTINELNINPFEIDHDFV